MSEKYIKFIRKLKEKKVLKTSRNMENELKKIPKEKRMEKIKESMGAYKENIGKGKFINEKDYQCECGEIVEDMKSILMTGENKLRDVPVDGDKDGEIQFSYQCKCGLVHYVSTSILKRNERR